MATEDCPFVTFVGSCGSTLCFQEVEDTDLEVDIFQKSPSLPTIHWIKNSCNDFLVVDNGDQLLFEQLSKQQENDCGCKFIIQSYNNQSGQTSYSGKPVIFYVTKNNQRKVLCCNKEGKISTEILDLPEKIDTDAHEALFYLKNVNGRRNTYMVESSFCSSHFLAFEPDTKDRSLKKLILRQKFDETDERCQILLL